MCSYPKQNKLKDWTRQKLVSKAAKRSTATLNELLKYFPNTENILQSVVTQNPLISLRNKVNMVFHSESIFLSEINKLNDFTNRKVILIYSH